MKQIVGLVLILCCTQMVAQEVFPDGKAIPEWFRENKEVNVNALGKKYSITDYGVANDRSEERRVGKECRSRWSPYH